MKLHQPPSTDPVLASALANASVALFGYNPPVRVEARRRPVCDSSRVPIFGVNMLQLSINAMRLLAIVILTAAAAGATASAPGTEAEIRERIAPFGQLRVLARESDAEAAVAVERAPRDGQAIYNQFCAACHVSGVAGAPLMTAEAWAPRIAQGMDVLYATTINGKGAMPPGGTCFDCTEEELKKTVDWMVESVQ